MPRLHVSGTVVLDNGGLDVSPAGARTREPNDRELSLDLVVEQPDVVTPSRTPYDVKYEEETEIEYETVSIRPDGPTGIPARDVH